MVVLIGLLPRTLGDNELEENKIRTLVCSGLGTGAGKVPFKKAAIDMAKAYSVFKNRPTTLSRVFATIRYRYIKGNYV